MPSPYIWQAEQWPRFTRNANRLLKPLSAARQAQGEFAGIVTTLGFSERETTDLDARTAEAVETADIEGETVSRAQVRSSIARRLNIDSIGRTAVDARVEGLVDMTIDAAVNYATPLDAERLHRWHAGLLPLPLSNSGQSTIAIGRWRNDATGPMQVVSGRIDRPTVHFQAPPAALISSMMAEFLKWFEAHENDDGLLVSATAHLWFVTIHPYDDGNGRMARAIADMALARDAKSTRRYYSMSRQINAEKSSYYAALERAQQATLDITDWLVWFLESYRRAIELAKTEVRSVLDTQNFWHLHEHAVLSDRQRRALTKLLRHVEGKLTVKKWRALTKTSTDTAQRDVNHLVEQGVLAKNSGGSKNTSYSVVGRKADESE